MNKTLRIVMIGPDPDVEGGASIPFRLLLNEMAAHDVRLTTIAVPVGRGQGIACRVLKALRLLAAMIRAIPRADLVSAHLPTLQLANVGVLALSMARLCGRAFVLRKFGGTDPAELAPRARFLAEQVAKRSDVLFIESRKQCDEIARRLGIRTFWFPNQRDSRNRVPRRVHWSGVRFAYVGHVRREKGIREILEAAASLRGCCSVDIYGPCDEEFDPGVFDQSSSVRYRGVVLNTDVPSILSQHDALLLPTYWRGEGYPGVVVEAFVAGVPVIATRWKFVPEMVDESCGMLVEPADAEGLTRALDRFIRDRQLAERLSAGASAKAEMFSVARWTDLFARTCRIVYQTSGDKTEMRRRIKVLYARPMDAPAGSMGASGIGAGATPENTYREAQRVKAVPS